MTTNETELLQIQTQIQSATTPEDIFGKDAKKAKAAYLRLMRVAHPDRNSGNIVLASKLAVDLNLWWVKADERIRNDSYGKAEPVVLKSPSGSSYELGPLWRKGDISDIYRTADGLIVKVCRNPRDNDLLMNEYSTIQRINVAVEKSARKIASGTAKLLAGDSANAELIDELNTSMDAGDWRPFFPEAVDTFPITRPKGARVMVNVLKIREGMYSLAEVKAAKGPLDPRDWAWMYRRLLMALGYVHSRVKTVHGAINLDHVLIHPSHGLTLIDWSYAVPTPGVLKAIPACSELDYNGVKLDQAVGPWLDIYLAAQVSKQMLGPAPTRLQRYFQSWDRLGPKSSQDAWPLLQEFTELLDDHWPRQYRPFTMP